MPEMPSDKHEQQLRNRASRHAWDEFAGHRREVMLHLTRGFAGRKLRLCVLGAGNCNDLDLGELLHGYGEVHLVDLDDEALSGVLARQGVEPSERLVLHGGLDASDRDGAAWQGRLPGPFDVVASVCLLSQLIDAVMRRDTVAESPPIEQVVETRDRHLRAMVDLISPGGWGLLITDFVSSESCPQLANVAEADLPALLAGLIAEQNFFHGLNPLMLRQSLKPPAPIAMEIAQSQLVRPWRWQLGARVYAVCALKFQRRE